MSLGNKLAPVELTSSLAFQDIIQDPPASVTDPVLFRKGDLIYQRDVSGVVTRLGSLSAATGVLSLANGGTGADLSSATVNALLVKLTNKVANGVSAIAYAVDNIADLVASGARLFSFRSAGAEKAAILGDGGLLAPSVGPSATQRHALPAVASDTVGLLSAPQTLAAKSFGNLPSSVPASTVGIGAANVLGSIGVGFKVTAGDQVFIATLGGSGSSQAVIASSAFTLAPNATKDIPISTEGGFATIADDMGNVVATFGFSRTAVTNTGGQTYTNFSTVLATAAKLNVNETGGLLRFENKTASALNLVVQFNFWQQS